MKTQKQIILDYLKKGKKINQRKAIAYFSIIRLSSVIFNLKKDGWEIEREQKKNLLFRGFYYEYKLKNILSL
jgi:hypothetical protein